MAKYCLFALLALAVCACQTQQAQTANTSAEKKVNSMSDSLVNSNSSEQVENIGEIVETFTDDLNIGVPRKNKIEISELTDVDQNIVEIKFYSLTTDKEWKLQQTITLDKDKFNGFNPKIKDFNNDGFKDLTYRPYVAGRGANELQRLFIYDKKKDELIFIKNSDEYPNLKYNKRLNSLTAQRFYGNTTVTDFIKIDGDALKEFAEVETLDKERTVSLIGKNGKKTILRKYTLNEEEPFERFINYNPLEYDNYDEEQ